MAEFPIGKIQVHAYKIPTDQPESDGTLKWTATTLVAVHIHAGDQTGFGYTYAHKAAGDVIADKLADVISGMDAFNIPACGSAMIKAIRNMGERGIARMAVSALDIALWDLKAKLLNLPLASLLGRVRDRVPVYGSGGFTSYSIRMLQEQLAGWVEAGIPRVKMKIGRDPDADPDRVRAARSAIGTDPALFVDANGGYTVKQAMAIAESLDEQGVVWFEEPVSQNDTRGLRLIRERTPAGLDVTAGEYGFMIDDFRLLLENGSVDVLMADATRCGFTGFMEAAALCNAFHVDLSSHCAPALHLHPAMSLAGVRHMEYFHDHVRIEHLLMEGLPQLQDGALVPDLSRPGHGLSLKADAARPYQVA